MNHETKYLEKLREWELTIKNMNGMPVKKVCSRMLKLFHDDYLINHRTVEEEKEIIDQCIEANIPPPSDKKMKFLTNLAKQNNLK